MKRFAQFVAAVMIGLLALAPALAAVPCAAGARATCSADCPMAMSGMGVDCPMPRQMTAIRCPGDCCANASALIVVPPAAPKKSRVAVTAIFSVAHAGSSATITSSTFDARPGALATSPPRYLLNQVFRI